NKDRHLKRNEKYKGFGFVVSLGTGLSRPPTDGETHPLFSSELIYLRPIWGLPRWVQRHSDCQRVLSGVALTDTERDDSTGTTRGLSNATWPLYPLPETLAGGCDTKWEF
ncbi:hypothetical protein H0E87_012480, partial [Populus deltoides]